VRIFHLVADRGIAPDGAKGAAVHFRHLHAALAAAGADVVAFASRKPADPAAFPGRLLPFDALADEARAGGPPDVVLERYSLGADAGLAFARAAGAVFALEVNAPLVDEARAHRPETVPAGAADVERRLWSEADVVLPVSDPLARLVASVRGRTDGVLTLRNGFESAAFRDPPRSAAAGPRCEIAFLGRPRPWHGAGRLPELVAAMVAAGCDARCVVIGGGEGADALATDAARAGVADRFEFTGDLPHSAAVLRFRRADLAVAPYPPTEPFYFSPLKAVEALAAGVPLVASALGDVPEIVGDAAVLVPAGDDAALLAACLGLAADPARRDELARRGRARAFGSMTWGHVASRLVAAVGAGAVR
jgi:glycosyltransferase involved in cell wall biosynthesis